MQLSKTYSAPKQRAARASAILRTRNVYIDNSYVRVAYQLKDSKGNTNIDTSGLSVKLTLSTPSTSCNGASPADGCPSISARTTTCGSPSSASGIGLCSVTLSTSWFARNAISTATVTATYSNVAYATAVAATSLHIVGQPPWYSSMDTTLSTDGMYATMPIAPKYAGESFTVHVYARATTYALVTWGIKLYLDTSRLTYVSGSGSSLYNPAVTSVGDGGSVIGAVAVGIKSTTKTSQVLGGAISVFSANLRISSSIATGSQRGAFTFSIDEMINQGSLAWVAGIQGIVLNPSSHISSFPEHLAQLPAQCPELSFTDTAIGDCPAGWACTGSAMVHACEPVSWTCKATGNYLVVNENGAVGSATSDLFLMPEGIAKLRYRQAGGADYPAKLALVEREMEGVEG